MSVRTAVLACLLLALVIFSPAVLVQLPGPAQRELLSSFGSFDEFRSFIDARSGLDGPPGGIQEVGAASTGTRTVGFSTTNRQVDGVDEWDEVKTDGSFVYVASGSKVHIIRAGPTGELELASTIEMDDVGGSSHRYAQTRGLFLSGDRLAVISTRHSEVYPLSNPEVLSLIWQPQNSLTTITTYDVSDRSRPSPTMEVGVSGDPITARLLDTRVFLLANSHLFQTEEGYDISKVCRWDVCSPVEPSKIYYDPELESPSNFINLLSVDLASGEADHRSILGGYASSLYMSQSNLYLAFPKSVPFVRVADSALSFEPEPRTTIYRLEVDGLQLRAVARGEVPGYPINQFAFDEWEGNLRVATTIDSVGNTSNSLHVLDSQLAVTGAVEGLAPGERIFSVRFLASKGYVVTFRRVDPLFVVDLSDPHRPAVLGVLKIPGFSQYLHPIEGGRLLGIGRETSDGGEVVRMEGLKVSLFDVSDPLDPVERANYVVGGPGTWSEVLYDHRAFMSIPSQQLFAIPVDDPGPKGWEGSAPPWRGIYVFQISDGQIQMKGQVSHDPSAAWGGPPPIKRSLHIGDRLYTISNEAIQANSLGDLHLIDTLRFHPEVDADNTRLG